VERASAVDGGDVLDGSTVPMLKSLHGPLVAVGHVAGGVGHQGGPAEHLESDPAMFGHQTSVDQLGQVPVPVVVE
jgi:hypothetical protein